MIVATPHNINWLLDKLFEASRALRSEMVDNPQFVFVTKERTALETILVSYMEARFGIMATMPKATKYAACSIFNIPHSGQFLTLVLIDL